MITKIITGCAIVLVIVFGVLFIKGQTPFNVNVSPSDCPDCPFAAMPGDTLMTETFTVNGVTKHYYRQAFLTSGASAATTTLCNIKMPSATSTIELFAMHITTNHTNLANTILAEFAEGITMNATTTVIDRMPLTANVDADFTATSTMATALSGGWGITGKNRYLVAKLELATTTTKGYCSAIVTEL